MNYLYYLVILSTLFFFGCEKKNKDSAKNHQLEQSLKICLNLDVRSLDPRNSHDHPSNHVVKMLFEGLFRTTFEGKIEPALVDHYEISADKKIYTFFLKDTKWSNGQPVTSFDFAYAWKQVIDPTLPNNGVHSFYPIKNVQEVIQGIASIEDIGIKTPDAKTLIVELKHPAPFFLETLTFSSFCPVSMEHDKINPSWSQNAGEEFICNGPFKLQEWKKGYEIVLEKNPLYCDASEIVLTKIKIGIVNDLNTQLSMFEKNEIDWIGKPLSKLPLDAIPSLKETGKLNYIKSLGLHWYFFNTQKFPFNNKKVRKAFAYAVNRKEITEHLLQENEYPATSVLPLMLSGKPSHFKDGDIELACQLLQEGLNELGTSIDKISSITLSYSSSEINDRVAQTIQQQWEKAFGIKVFLQHQEWKTYYDQLLKGDYEIGAMGWYSWIRDPSYNLETFKYASDGINMSRWENPDYQNFLNLAQAEIDEEKRKMFFQLAEDLLMEEMPVIPLYFNNITFAKKDNLSNFYISELNEIDLTRAYFR